MAMRELFLRIESWTTRIAMAGACAMLAIASALGVFQIVTRFVLEQPAEWSEVLIRFSLIWMVFLGIPMAFRQGAMVSVDALYRAVPAGARRVLDLVVALAALAAGVLAWLRQQRRHQQGRQAQVSDTVTHPALLHACSGQTPAHDNCHRRLSSAAARGPNQEISLSH